MSHRYIPSLDGLRSIAVGIVLAAHGGISWFRSGGVGVDIFFVLSGFLITSILAGEAAATGSINFRNFYVRRFLRLAPCLFVTCAFVAVCLWHFEHRFAGTEIAIALTYTANWARALWDYDLSWLTHCWSLAVEEQFYLIWPLVILGLERSVRSPLVKGLLLVCASLAIAVYRAGFVGIYTDERINYGLDTRMDSLMTGAALAYFARALPAGGLSDAMSRWLGRVVAPAAMAVLFAIPQIVTWYSPWMGRFGYVIVAGASACVLFDLVAGRHSLFARPLASAPAVFLGKISYGIYLLHLPIYFIIERTMPDAAFLVKLSLKLSLSFGIAAASYYLIERHCLKLKSRFESTPAAARIAQLRHAA